MISASPNLWATKKVQNIKIKMIIFVNVEIIYRTKFGVMSFFIKMFYQPKSQTSEMAQGYCAVMQA